jgi:hypothetical protein
MTATLDTATLDTATLDTATLDAATLDAATLDAATLDTATLDAATLDNLSSPLHMEKFEDIQKNYNLNYRKDHGQRNKKVHKFRWDRRKYRPRNIDKSAD